MIKQKQIEQISAVRTNLDRITGVDPCTMSRERRRELITDYFRRYLSGCTAAERELILDEAKLYRAENPTESARISARWRAGEDRPVDHEDPESRREYIRNHLISFLANMSFSDMEAFTANGTATE